MRIIRTLAALACSLVWLCGCSSRTAPARQQGAPSAADANVAAAPDGARQPQDAAGYVALGNDLYRRDRDEEALAAYQQAVKLDPAYAEAYLKLGLTYRVLGQKKEAEESFDKAVKAYEQAVKADAKDARAQYNLAEAYSQTGEYQKAVDAYKRAMKLQDPDSETYYNLGEAYTKLARYKEAMEAYKHALDLDPDFFRASEALERAKAGNERVEAARREFERQLQRKRAENSNEEEDNQNGNRNTNQVNVNAPRGNANH